MPCEFIRLHSGGLVGMVRPPWFRTWWIRDGALMHGTIREMRPGDLGANALDLQSVRTLYPVTAVERVPVERMPCRTK